MTAEKKSRPISFALVTAGLAFFFNPQFAALDLLPDFIGCLLILWGLARVAHINRQLAETRAAFTKLLSFCIFKDLATVIVFAMTTDAERPVALLLVAFVGAVIGYYLAYGAFHALFEGLYALSVLRDCKPLYGKYRQLRLFGWKSRELSRPELALRYTLVFLAVREGLAVLPEFAALTTSSYTDSAFDRIYEYIVVMRTLSALVVLIAGLVWLALILRFFGALRREHDFRTALGEEESAWRAAHPGNAITKRFAVSFTLISIGSFFLADFRLDLQNLLPDIVASLFFLAGILLLKLPAKQKLCLFSLGALFGAAATVSEHFAFAFSSNFKPSAISKAEDAANAYLAMWATALLEFFLFLGFLVLLLFALRRVIREHAGYIPQHDDLEFERRRRAAYLEEFDRDLLRVFYFGFIAGLCSFLYDYIQEIPNKRIFRILEFFWGIDLCFSVVFAILLTVLLTTVRREISGRYALEG